MNIACIKTPRPARLIKELTGRVMIEESALYIGRDKSIRCYCCVYCSWHSTWMKLTKKSGRIESRADGITKWISITRDATQAYIWARTEHSLATFMHAWMKAVTINNSEPLTHSYIDQNQMGFHNKRCYTGLYMGNDKAFLRCFYACMDKSSHDR